MSHPYRPHLSSNTLSLLCPLLCPGYERGRLYHSSLYHRTVPQYSTSHFTVTVQYVTLHSNKLFLTTCSILYLNGWYHRTVPQYSTSHYTVTVQYVTLHSNKLFLTTCSSLTQALTFPTCIPKAPARIPPTNRPCLQLPWSFSGPPNMWLFYLEIRCDPFPSKSLPIHIN